MIFKSQNPEDRKYMILAFKIVGDFSAILVIPVLIFTFLGRYLDNRFVDGKFRFTILALILSALFSGFIINKKAKMYGEEFIKIDQKTEK